MGRIRVRMMGLVCFIAAAGALGAQPAPTELEGLAYDLEFFPGSSYDSSIPSPEEILGFRPGDRAAFPHEIEECLEAWAEASPRARLVKYAESYEGRSLYYVIVSSAANLADLEAKQQGHARLADPRGLSATDGRGLIESQPAVAWMAYSIHGDETSGSDSSLAVLHHLIASEDAGVAEILDNVIVLIDPMQNPDGRHRHLQQVAEYRAAAPNVDDQSMLHQGYWPWGRGNHYLFDLNRDWILGINPESRGRIRAAGSWHPQLMMDAHEMGSQSTYLFSPAREPRNPLIPQTQHSWAKVFANDQAAAFDRYQWPYYNAEWNEGWYPGYTDAWGQFRGAIGILYEQSSYAEDGVRRPSGEIVTYREAVHHQAVSSIANLKTLADNRAEILGDYLKERRLNVAADSPWAGRTYAVPPSPNRSRLAAFMDLMELQGFEVYETTSSLTVTTAVDQYGHRPSRETLPAGTLLIPNRQPEARLVATMFEFDLRMPDDYLQRERGSILRSGQSTIYDSTAWNITMLYGLEAFTIDGAVPSDARRWQAADSAESAPVAGASEAVAWAVDGDDDSSVVFAARLMERGVRVRVGDRSLELRDGSFARGSVVVQEADNRRFEGDLTAALHQTAGEVDVEITPLSSGFGEGDLPDLGGGHFSLLEPPRIGLLNRGGLSMYDFGSIWHMLDQQFGIRHSQLDEAALAFTDLRRYNVLVLPDRWWSPLSEPAAQALGTWVKAGGTLIANAASAGEVAKEDAGLSSARGLADVLESTEPYRMAVLREQMALEKALPDSEETWSHVARPGGSFPWQGMTDLEEPSEEERKRHDEWAAMFMPQGAFLAARTDDEHWLTFGVSDRLPVLANSGVVLMAKPPVEAPVRFGVMEEASGSEPELLGWSVVPPGNDLRLRMSGLLWPEAASRLANSAVVTRESVGSGQIILFANTPTFRATTRGTARLLMNALIYGPGFGGSAPITP